MKGMSVKHFGNFQDGNVFGSLGSDEDIRPFPIVSGSIQIEWNVGLQCKRCVIDSGWIHCNWPSTYVVHAFSKKKSAKSKRAFVFKDIVDCFQVIVRAWKTTCSAFVPAIRLLDVFVIKILDNFLAKTLLLESNWFENLVWTNSFGKQFLRIFCTVGWSSVRVIFG